MELARVDWVDPRALLLRDAMEAEMTFLYADSLRSIDPTVMALLSASFDVAPGTIVGTVLALDDGVAVGHAALRPYGDTQPGDIQPGGTVFEVKKVIVDVTARGRGISRLLMLELETVAGELGATSLILQTGDLQPAAIALYESLGYRQTPPYAPYELMANALCYAKRLTA